MIRDSWSVSGGWSKEGTWCGGAPCVFCFLQVGDGGLAWVLLIASFEVFTVSSFGCFAVEWGRWSVRGRGVHGVTWAGRRNGMVMMDCAPDRKVLGCEFKACNGRLVLVVGLKTGNGDKEEDVGFRRLGCFTAKGGDGGWRLLVFGYGFFSDGFHPGVDEFKLPAMRRRARGFH